MNKWSIGCLASLMLAVLPTGQESPQQLRREWTDADTGHRIVRLSDEPGSQSLYFHQNAYTPDGAKLIITTPTGLATINLRTRSIETVNADETLLAGTITEGTVPGAPKSGGRDSYPGKGDMMERRLAARLP